MLSRRGFKSRPASFALIRASEPFDLYVKPGLAKTIVTTSELMGAGSCISRRFSLCSRDSLKARHISGSWASLSADAREGAKVERRNAAWLFTRFSNLPSR